MEQTITIIDAIAITLLIVVAFLVGMFCGKVCEKDNEEG